MTSRLSPYFWLIIAVLVLGLLFAYQHRSGIVSDFRQFVADQLATGTLLAVGKPLPRLELSTFRGARISIRPQSGRVLYLNVFTTWCPDCFHEMPALERLRKATAGKPLDIVGIDQQEGADVVTRFAVLYGLSFPIFIDDRHLTQQMLGVRYIPTTLIVDGHGIVLASHAGVLTFAQMTTMVDDALSGRPGRE